MQVDVHENIDELPVRIKKIYNSCGEEEKHYLRKILQELSEFGFSTTYEQIWLYDYVEVPVDIETFLSHDLYLGKSNSNGTSIYPTWHKVLTEIFNAGNKWEEVFLSGATRIGKTTTAISGMAYMLYKLMCLRDPQRYFNKKEISKFTVSFFNVTKDLARGVAFKEFQDTLRVSPWFNQHGSFSRSENNYYYIPNGGKVEVTYGSDAAHALGQQIFACMIDEINFSRAGIKDINKAKEHMRDTYNTIVTRVKGTFRMNGEVYGKVFAVSSKRTDSDFMEAYLQEQVDAGATDHIYIFDKPQWEVLPSSTFSKQTFYLAVGDRYKRGFVVPEDQTTPEALEDLMRQGYSILTPPIDLRSQFLADYDIALRDIAGISVTGALSYITQDSLDSVINKARKNPFYNDVITIGTKDTLTIEEFFHIEEVPRELLHAEWYMHLDLSLVTDRTGMSAVAVTHRKDMKTEDGKTVSMPFLTHAFSVALEAPRGDKIPYSKIVVFICWLRKRGINIKLISRDQFQSEYLAQILEEQGFNTTYTSLDRTPDGYMTTRSIILEQRIDMLDMGLLQDELVHLQRNGATGRIDHPVGGSKDVADSFAGAIFSCIKDSPGIPVPRKSVINAITQANLNPLATLGTRNTSNRPSIFDIPYKKF